MMFESTAKKVSFEGAKSIDIDFCYWSGDINVRDRSKGFAHGDSFSLTDLGKEAVECAVWDYVRSYKYRTWDNLSQKKCAVEELKRKSEVFAAIVSTLESEITEAESEKAEA